MSFGNPKLPKGIKVRRHHNNKGLRQIKAGKTASDVKRMAKRLGVPFRCKRAEHPLENEHA